MANTQIVHIGTISHLPPFDVMFCATCTFKNMFTCWFNRIETGQIPRQQFPFRSLSRSDFLKWDITDHYIMNIWDPSGSLALAPSKPPHSTSPKVLLGTQQEPPSVRWFHLREPNALNFHVKTLGVCGNVLLHDAFKSRKALCQSGEILSAMFRTC